MGAGGRLPADSGVALTRAAQIALVAAYADTLCGLAIDARGELVRAVDDLLAARAQADAALRRCRQLSALAERYALFAARARAGDAIDGELAIAAEAIAALTGLWVEGVV